MKQSSSELINAIADYCEKYSSDPNLFSQNIISEHPECTTLDLKTIEARKFEQGDILNA